MADNTVIPLGTQDGDTIALDDIGGVKYPRSKITLGADGVNGGDVSSSNPMPVTGTLTGVTTVATVTTLGTITNVVHVDDNSGSLTIDNAALSVTGGGVEASALRVTIASDSTGVLSVDDNSSSLTVDAPVGTPVFVRLSDGSSAITTLPVSLASVPSHAVTNAGVFAVQIDGPGLTSLQLLDDVIGTSHDAAPGKIAVVGGKYSATPPTLDDGDACQLRINVDQALVVCDEGQKATIGSTSETAPATDTASSGLNGRLQRIAQRLTSLIAQIPASLGIKTAAESLSVAPASDAVFAASQNGTWNITNISGTVSLPTGAATATKQPALGTAGTASSDVLTVQGIASMTALKVDGSAVTQPVSGTVTATISAGATTIAKAEDAAHSTGDVGVFALTVRSDTAASTAGTDGDYAALTTDSTGRLHVNVGNTVTVGSHAVTNAGVFAVQSTLQAGTAYAGKVRLTDGTTDADVRDLANSNAINVSIVDGSGDQITSFGGGTQYTEGDTDATITGTACMMEVAANTLQPVQGTVADGLLVNLGSNNDVTVTGTVTANAGSGTFAISAAALPLPSGAATAAKQPALGTAGTASADVITIQGIASMTAVKVDGSAVTQPVSGTFWQATQPVSIAASVTVVNSGTFAVQSTLQAGTAYVGKVRLTDGTTDVDIRDLTNSNAINVAIVDSSGDQIASFGGGTQYTEGDTDATITGTACMMEVAANTLQPVQGTVADGLLVNLGSNNDVTVTGTVTANIGTVGTLATAANQTTIIGHVDGIEGLLTTIDADTGGIATSAATIAGAVSGNEMQVDVLTMPTVTVTGTVTATISASATTIAKEEDAASANQDVGVPAMAVRKATPANTSGTDGDYEMLQMSAGRLWTSSTIDTALPAGTNAIGKLASNAGVTIGAVEIAAAQTLATVTTVSTVTTCSTVTTLTGGGVAHDGADSGNPHKIGAKAKTALSAVTLVAADDRTDLFAGVDGVLVVRNHCNLEDIVSGNASNTDGTSTQCIAAQASGIKTYLTRVTLTNTSSTMRYVELKDGSTVKHTVPVPATGGATVDFDPPLPGTAATAWNFDPDAAATTIICSMVGFKSKV